MKKALLTMGLVLFASSVVAGSNICVGAIVISDGNGCQTISNGNNVVSSGNITVNGKNISRNTVVSEKKNRQNMAYKSEQSVDTSSINRSKNRSNEKSRIKIVTWSREQFKVRAPNTCVQGFYIIKNPGTGQVYICD